MTPALQLTVAIAAAFAVTSLLIALSAGPARRLGLIDRPDSRKRHAHPTPLTGGVCILAGFLVGVALIDPGAEPFWTLPLGMVLLGAVGMIDDVLEVSASARLLAQIAAAALMVFAGGLEIRTLGFLLGSDFGPVLLGPLSAVFTIACVVFVINALNMMDGLDGLAGGVAAIIFSMLAVVAWLDGAPPILGVTAMLLAAACAGFLLFNVRLPGRSHARVFLGDSGSMLVGYAIAWLAVALGTRSDGVVYPITIAWLLIVPGMDTLALFFRRIRLRRSPFSADRNHLHHIILRSGVSHGGTVSIIHALVAVTGAIGIVGWLLERSQALLFVTAALLMAGYQVFLANAHRILRWHFRRRRRLAGGRRD